MAGTLIVVVCLFLTCWYLLKFWLSGRKTRESRRLDVEGMISDSDPTAKARRFREEVGE